MVQDEIGGDKPQAVQWGMHTRAIVELSEVDPATLLLHQGGRTLGARIVEPKGARFEVLSTFRPPPQQANLGVVKIAVNLDTVTEGTARRILILLEPGAESAPEPIAWVPLAAWATKLKQ